MVHHGDVRTQLAVHLAHQMEHVGVPLHDHEIGNPHAAESCHPPNVVPSEIDEHEMLGAFLLVGQQLARQPRVRFSASTARPRPGDRPHRHAAVTKPHEELGRAAHQLHAIEP